MRVIKAEREKAEFLDYLDDLNSYIRIRKKDVMEVFRGSGITYERPLANMLKYEQLSYDKKRNYGE
jgi:hypothetical protein